MSNWLVRRLAPERPGGVLGARVQTIVVADTQAEARSLGAADLGVSEGEVVVVDTAEFLSSWSPGQIR